MHDLDAIIERMHGARSALLGAADQVPGIHWQERPDLARWSAAEVIAHLTQVENAITAGAAKLVQGEPRPVPRWKRWHIPFWMVEIRLARRKTPIPLDPAIVAAKEEMLARLREARRRTLAFLDESRPGDFSGYFWPHPFLGNLNFYDWFRFMAHHEIRHTKQIREIVTSFHE